jgi:hypothetical protein
MIWAPLVIWVVALGTLALVNGGALAVRRWLGRRASPRLALRGDAGSSVPALEALADRAQRLRARAYANVLAEDFGRLRVSRDYEAGFLDALKTLEFLGQERAAELLVCEARARGNLPEVLRVAKLRGIRG